MEDIEEPAADGGGQDVVLVDTGTRADSSEGQKHSQRRTHAEEILYLRDEIFTVNMEVCHIHIDDICCFISASFPTNMETSEFIRNTLQQKSAKNS